MTVQQDHSDNFSDCDSEKGLKISDSFNSNPTTTSSPSHSNSVSSQSDCSSDGNGIISSSTCDDSESNANTFEGLLKLCGEAGKWQFKIFLLASFCGFCTALHNLIYAFVGNSPDHWCALPEIDGHSYSELKSMLVPRNVSNEDKKCKQYLFNISGSGGIIVDEDEISSCRSYEFDHSTYKNTIVTEFDLVCKDTAWAATVQAMFMFGILCGSPIFGALSDQYGRKKTILIATIIFVIAGPIVGIVRNFYILMIARFILGASSPGIYGTSFVLVIEILGTDWRGLAGNLFCLPFAVGYMFLAGVAYYIREWRYLQLVLSIPSVILLATGWFLPESPRWLMRKGRTDEAEAILRQAAGLNGRKKLLPHNFGELVAKIGNQEKEEIVSIRWKKRFTNVLNGYANLLRSPKLRLRTLVIYFCWASISMIYYGIALNSPNLSADPYLYMFLGGVLEVPSYFMVPPLIRVLGRRPVFSGFLLICSAALWGSLLFEPGSAYIIILSLFGKLVIGGAYSLVYLYATELMPTLLRTYGLGTASMIGRIGSISAPYVVELLGKENNTYPSIVFGSFALMAGLLSILLPETLNRRLPETVEDIEFNKI